MPKSTEEWKALHSTYQKYNQSAAEIRRCLTESIRKLATEHMSERTIKRVLHDNLNKKTLVKQKR